MKNNVILKIISYVCVCIFSAVFLFGTFYSFFMMDQQKYLEEIKDEEGIKEDFFKAYMTEISELSRQLIYRNNDYTQLKDNDKTICYFDLYGFANSLSKQIDDLTFLIIYKDKALTNLELTSDTTTIEEIKNYINQNDKKHTTFINGEVKSDTELINKKAIQYFETFEFSYYKTRYSDVTDEVVWEDNYEHTYRTYNTTINDFEIYTSYNEVLIYNRYNNNNEEIKNFLTSLEPYSNNIYMSIPISCIIVMICGIYLICSIGHRNDKEKIKLNTFDKIWFEVIFFIASTIIGFGIAIPLEFGLYSNNLSCIISIIVTGYILDYIIGAITLTTFIKRIKAKSFWSTTLIGKCIKWFIKKIRSCFKFIKENYNEIKKTLPHHTKLISYIIGFIFLEIILIVIFNFLGVILDILLLVYLYSKVLKVIRSYEKIEEKLKDMYEGNNLVKLSENDVEEDFKNSVKYINDISNGFENAIKESIKSERLKTELITNVSHDIKTPLTSIINYVDLLKQEDIKNEKVEEYIKILDGKSQRLKKLTEDLVEASKASSGSIKLNFEKINIVELLKQAIGEFEDKFNKKELEIIFEYDKSEIEIKADSRYLYRVIENLFSNISKYALDKSRVYIDVIEKDNKINISIKNISKERLNISSDELMQRFVRGDKSRTTEGSGLGISIAKSLTELQNGKFDLQIDGDLFKALIIFGKNEN